MCMCPSLHMHVYPWRLLEDSCNTDAWTIWYVFITTGDKNQVLMEKVIAIHDFQLVSSVHRIYIKPSHSPSLLADRDGWKCQVPRDLWAHIFPPPSISIVFIHHFAPRFTSTNNAMATFNGFELLSQTAFKGHRQSHCAVSPAATKTRF